MTRSVVFPPKQCQTREQNAGSVRCAGRNRRPTVWRARPHRLREHRLRVDRLSVRYRHANRRWRASPPEREWKLWKEQFGCK